MNPLFLALAITSTVAEPCPDVSSLVRPARMEPEMWGYYSAMVGWRCEARQAEAGRVAAEKKIKAGERTVSLAEKIIDRAPPAAAQDAGLSTTGVVLVVGGAIAVVAAVFATGFAMGSKE